MKVRVNKGKARGFVEAPPSKSMAHRLLICAGLADGTSEIEGIADSQDILATLDCLKALGTVCERVNGASDTMKITGVGSKIWGCRKKRILNCRESGSTLRFLCPCVSSRRENRSLGEACGSWKGLWMSMKSSVQNGDSCFAGTQANSRWKDPLRQGLSKLPAIYPASL